MLHIDARSLKKASARLFDRRSRIVGWGSGSVFDYFQRLYPVRLEYVVDNDPARHGDRLGDVGIVGPNRLASEDPADTLVIIYSSAWPEIQQQIQQLGSFVAVPASAVFADAATRARLDWAETVASQRPPSRQPQAYNTIVIQGPVIAGVTPHVLRVMTALYPSNLILLSTWADTEPELLATVSSLADDTVLSRRPDVAGVQNRNAQIISTKAGIDRAIARGARTILKTRTDVALLAPSLFGQAHSWLDPIDRKAARAAGLRDRLIVPASYTRKCLLYHPSDLVMLGAAEDLARYWSAPLDTRTGELLAPERIDLPLSSVNMDGHPAESYLGLEFCRTIGRRAQGTVADSWAFYRDLFAVVDNDWFDLLWFKNLSIPDVALRAGARQLVTQSFWRRLYSGDPLIDRELGEVNADRLSLRMLAGAA